MMIDDTPDGLAEDLSGRELPQISDVDGMSDEDLASALQQARDLGDADFERDIKHEIARRKHH